MSIRKSSIFFDGSEEIHTVLSVIPFPIAQSESPVWGFGCETGWKGNPESGRGMMMMCVFVYLGNSSTSVLFASSRGISRGMGILFPHGLTRYCCHATIGCSRMVVFIVQGGNFQLDDFIGCGVWSCPCLS